MQNTEILNSILDRPDLPGLTDFLNRKLADEASARANFRRNLSPSVKSEFIAGQVIMHSPAKAKHLLATGRLYKLLDTFVEIQQLGQVFSEKALIALTRNDYEPDIVFFCGEKSKAFVPDQMEFPAPDFVVEVLSDSTEYRDCGVKFMDYAQHQVREYWIINCDEQSIEHYELNLETGAYSLIQKLLHGRIESLVVKGFSIPVEAVFDAAANLQTLRDLTG